MGDRSPINITKDICKQFNPPPLVFSFYSDSRMAMAQNDGVTGIKVYYVLFDIASNKITYITSGNI